VLNKIKNKLKFFILISVSTAILIIIIFIGFYLYYQNEIPDYTKLINYENDSTSNIYSNDGFVIGQFSKTKRTYISYKNIPDLLIKAIISAEDKNFFKHKGIDFIGIIRAAINNVTKPSNMQGASTITQQLIKNTLLTNEKTLSRKFKELILSIKIESELSKEKIIEIYLNEIYLGSRSYGIVSAAKKYFGKSLNHLSLEEIALIASLPKAPSSLNPFINPEGAIDRRNKIINLMEKNGYISTEEMTLAIQQPLNLQHNNYNNDHNKYFTEEIHKKILEQNNKNIDLNNGISIFSTLDSRLQQYAHWALRNGLLKYSLRHSIHKPIDHIDMTKDWQNQIQNLIKPNGSEDWDLAVIIHKNIELEEYTIGLKSGKKGIIKFNHLDNLLNSIKLKDISYLDKPSDLFKKGDVILVSEDLDSTNLYKYKQIPKINGAIVVLDPNTGKILSMDSGFSFDISNFNRTTQALRQPGSAFKPFIYLSALENGYTPASIIEDEPINYKIYNNSISDKKNHTIWSPQNHSGDYYGPTTVRKSLEMSRNVPTVRLAIDIGLDKIKNTAKNFNLIPDDYKNKKLPITSILGSLETTLLDLTNSYAMIANGGRKISPFYIEYISDNNGKTIYRHNKKCLICNSFFDIDNPPNHIINNNNNKGYASDKKSIYQLTSILQGVIERGTGRKASFLPYTIAGKTGTTNNSKDAWFIGFTNNLAVGVYVGFDKPKSLGKYEEGSSVALPIFIDFMEKALALYPPKELPVPDGINFIPIDMETGTRPNLYTNKNNIIMEVFKNNEQPNPLNKKTVDRELEDNIINQKDTTPNLAEPYGIY